MNELDIYFSDLTPEAQKRVLDLYGYRNPAEGNLDMDIVPLFILRHDEEDV